MVFSRKRKDNRSPSFILDDSPKRTKVQAQRKFAQGSNVNSPVLTPVKEIECQEKLIPEPIELLPMKRPNTEDFLTFLCFRGTPVLPPNLNFFNNASMVDTRPQSSESPSTSPKNGVIFPTAISKCQGERPFIAFGVRKRADPIVVSRHMDKKRRHALALQALRRKYQEQKMAKIRAITISKLSEKVQTNKTVVRTTRSVTKSDHTITKKNIAQKTKITVVSTKRVKVTTRRTSTLKPVVRSGGSKQKMCLRSYRGRFVQRELVNKPVKKRAVNKSKCGEDDGSSEEEFSSDDDEPLLKKVQKKGSKKVKKSTASVKKQSEITYRLTRSNQIITRRLPAQSRIIVRTQNTVKSPPNSPRLRSQLKRKLKVVKQEVKTMPLKKHLITKKVDMKRKVLRGGRVREIEKRSCVKTNENPKKDEASKKKRNESPEEKSKAAKEPEEKRVTRDAQKKADEPKDKNLKKLDVKDKVKKQVTEKKLVKVEPKVKTNQIVEEKAKLVEEKTEPHESAKLQKPKKAALTKKLVKKVKKPELEPANSPELLKKKKGNQQKVTGKRVLVRNLKLVNKPVMKNGKSEQILKKQDGEETKEAPDARPVRFPRKSKEEGANRSASASKNTEASDDEETEADEIAGKKNVKGKDSGADKKKSSNVVKVESEKLKILGNKINEEVAIVETKEEDKIDQVKPPQKIEEKFIKGGKSTCPGSNSTISEIKDLKIEHKEEEDKISAKIVTDKLIIGEKLEEVNKSVEETKTSSNANAQTKKPKRSTRDVKISGRLSEEIKPIEEEAPKTSIDNVKKSSPIEETKINKQADSNVVAKSNKKKLKARKTPKQSVEDTSKVTLDSLKIADEPVRTQTKSKDEIKTCEGTEALVNIGTSPVKIEASKILETTKNIKATLLKTNDETNAQVRKSKGLDEDKIKKDTIIQELKTETEKQEDFKKSDVLKVDPTKLSLLEQRNGGDIEMKKSEPQLKRLRRAGESSSSLKKGNEGKTVPHSNMDESDLENLTILKISEAGLCDQSNLKKAEAGLCDEDHSKKGEAGLCDPDNLKKSDGLSDKSNFKKVAAALKKSDISSKKVVTKGEVSRLKKGHVKNDVTSSQINDVTSLSHGDVMPLAKSSDSPRCKKDPIKVDVTSSQINDVARLGKCDVRPSAKGSDSLRLKGTNKSDVTSSQINVTNLGKGDVKPLAKDNDSSRPIINDDTGLQKNDVTSLGKGDSDNVTILNMVNVPRLKKTYVTPKSKGNIANTEAGDVINLKTQLIKGMTKDDVTAITNNYAENSKIADLRSLRSVDMTLIKSDEVVSLKKIDVTSPKIPDGKIDVTSPKTGDVKSLTKMDVTSPRFGDVKSLKKGDTPTTPDATRSLLSDLTVLKKGDITTSVTEAKSDPKIGDVTSLKKASVINSTVAVASTHLDNNTSLIEVDDLNLKNVECLKIGNLKNDGVMYSTEDARSLGKGDFIPITTKDVPTSLKVGYVTNLKNDDVAHQKVIGDFLIKGDVACLKKGSFAPIIEAEALKTSIAAVISLNEGVAVSATTEEVIKSKPGSISLSINDSVATIKDAGGSLKLGDVASTKIDDFTQLTKCFRPFSKDDVTPTTTTSNSYVLGDVRTLKKGDGASVEDVKCYNLKKYAAAHLNKGVVSNFNSSEVTGIVGLKATAEAEALSLVKIDANTCVFENTTRGDVIANVQQPDVPNLQAENNVGKEVEGDITNNCANDVLDKESNVLNKPNLITVPNYAHLLPKLDFDLDGTHGGVIFKKGLDVTYDVGRMNEPSDSDGDDLSDSDADTGLRICETVDGSESDATQDFDLQSINKFTGTAPEESVATNEESKKTDAHLSFTHEDFNFRSKKDETVILGRGTEKSFAGTNASFYKEVVDLQPKKDVLMVGNLTEASKKTDILMVGNPTEASKKMDVRKGVDREANYSDAFDDGMRKKSLVDGDLVVKKKYDDKVIDFSIGGVKCDIRSNKDDVEVKSNSHVSTDSGCDDALKKLADVVVSVTSCAEGLKKKGALLVGDETAQSKIDVSYLKKEGVLLKTSSTAKTSPDIDLLNKSRETGETNVGDYGLQKVSGSNIVSQEKNAVTTEISSVVQEVPNVLTVEVKKKNDPVLNSLIEDAPNKVETIVGEEMYAKKLESCVDAKKPKLAKPKSKNKTVEMLKVKPESPEKKKVLINEIEASKQLQDIITEMAKELAAKDAQFRPLPKQPKEDKDMKKKSIKKTTVAKKATKPAETKSYPRLSQRPSRKTKEAAAVYMEILGHKLGNEEGDDDVSIDSFPELPNVRKMEQRENELKAKAFKDNPPLETKQVKKRERKLPKASGSKSVRNFTSDSDESYTAEIKTPPEKRLRQTRNTSPKLYKSFSDTDSESDLIPIKQVVKRKSDTLSGDDKGEMKKAKLVEEEESFDESDEEPLVKLKMKKKQEEGKQKRECTKKPQNYLPLFSSSDDEEKYFHGFVKCESPPKPQVLKMEPPVDLLSTKDLGRRYGKEKVNMSNEQIEKWLNDSALAGMSVIRKENDEMLKFGEKIPTETSLENLADINTDGLKSSLLKPEVKDKTATSTSTTPEKYASAMRPFSNERKTIFRKEKCVPSRNVNAFSVCNESSVYAFEADNEDSVNTPFRRPNRRPSSTATSRSEDDSGRVDTEQKTTGKFRHPNVIRNDCPKTCTKDTSLNISTDESNNSGSITAQKTVLIPATKLPPEKCTKPLAASTPMCPPMQTTLQKSKLENRSSRSCSKSIDRVSDASEEFKYKVPSSPSASSSSSAKLYKRNAKSRPKGPENYTPINATEFPSMSQSARIVEAPVFHPNEKEFVDPIEYIEKIREKAQKFGICRIVPPPNFKPECKVLDEMRFTAYNQYVHKMMHRWGPNFRELVAIRKYLATQSISLKHPPWIGGMEIDLPRLYQTVQTLGGLKEVIEKKKWPKVSELMKIPKSAQDRVTKLDDIYCKYLLPYDTLSPDERDKLFDSVETEWAKRESKNLLKAQQNGDEERKSEDEDMESEDEEESDIECIMKGRSMALNTFFRIARNSMAMWFKNQEPDAREVEEEFWKHVTTKQYHICVHSGSIDSGNWGYGFAVSKNSPFARHAWNLKVLTNNSGSVLRSMGPLMGLTVPTLHVGMVFSGCCWYRDPHGLPWIEYLHTGANKIWYGIPDTMSEKFHSTLLNLVPNYCLNKSIWLPSDTVMLPPELLVDSGVSLTRTVQKPGQFIVIFPKAFTSNICTGYVVSESVFFAPPHWLDSAEYVFEELRNSCEPSMFSYERLLLSIANDSRSDVKVLKQIVPAVSKLCEREKMQREQLKSLGVTGEERLPIPDNKKKKKMQDSETEYACEDCRWNLFCSMVFDTQENGIYCLEHAINHLQGKILESSNCRLMYTYDAAELDVLVKNLNVAIEVKLQKKSHSRQYSLPTMVNL